MQLYAKIWEKRHRAVCPISQRQKAFVPVDGCCQNVRIIQSIIKRHRKERQELNLVFLYLAKAFDTVNHKSIEKALRRKQVPEGVTTHILSLYNGASTSFNTPARRAEKIAIRSGVKQGCPLSPLLFNLIMDELECWSVKRKLEPWHSRTIL